MIDDRKSSWFFDCEFCRAINTRTADALVGPSSREEVVCKRCGKMVFFPNWKDSTMLVDGEEWEEGETEPERVGPSMYSSRLPVSQYGRNLERPKAKGNLPRIVVSQDVDPEIERLRKQIEDISFKHSEEIESLKSEYDLKLQEADEKVENYKEAIYLIAQREKARVKRAETKTRKEQIEQDKIIADLQNKLERLAELYEFKLENV